MGAVVTWSRHINDGEQSPRTRHFVDAMREVRDRNGWSRGSVAAVAARAFPGTRITGEIIRDLELGRRATLTLDEAVAIAASLGTTVVQLLGEEV